MIETKIVTTYNNFTLFYDNGKLIECSSFTSCCRELGEQNWWFAAFHPIDKETLVFQRKITQEQDC